MNALLDAGAVNPPDETSAVVTSVPVAGEEPSGIVPLENVNWAVGFRCATPMPPRTYGMMRLLVGTSTRSPPDAYVAGAGQFAALRYECCTGSVLLPSGETILSQHEAVHDEAGNEGARAP